MVNIYFCVINDTTAPILKELREIRCKKISLWFDKETYSSNKLVKFIKDKKCITHTNIENGFSFFQWDLGQAHVSYCDEGQKHLVSRQVSDGTDFVCIDVNSHIKNQLVFFQDAAHKNDYPDVFVKVPCFNNKNELLNYLTDKGVFAFSLDDTNRFIKCAGINPVQGASVYKEKGTGYFWYLDMLHKNHYEVFDKTGHKHLGEADLEGNIDESKADRTKHLN